ncbi:tripartite tricarboxylate transporter TctB family protein [Litchfieldella rifensis]|uniref:Tripartite tricarboxylate transporter TctB family protein n=1 Tax=Litchfieldella rifensis TaxID=762643 RepID=A0ABV7LUK2_9GAMM
MTVNDRIVGVLMLTLAVAYGWGATQFSEPFGGDGAVGPSTFPKVISVIVALCSLYLIVKPDPDNPYPSWRTGLELVFAMLVMIAYTLLLEPLGFILATLVAVGTLCWRMGARPPRAFGISAVAGVAVYALFTYALDLALPLGVLSILEV